jgi:hypothetical protein
MPMRMPRCARLHRRVFANACGFRCSATPRGTVVTSAALSARQSFADFTARVAIAIACKLALTTSFLPRTGVCSAFSHRTGNSTGPRSIGHALREEHATLTRRRRFRIQ